MKKVNTVVFLAVLLVFVGTVTLFPYDERVIEYENRSFNQFPELTAENVFGGGFGKQFEEWIADRVGYRADFVSASMSIAQISGVDPPAPRLTPPSAQISSQAPPPQPSASALQHEPAQQSSSPFPPVAQDDADPAKGQGPVQLPQEEASENSPTPETAGGDGSGQLSAEEAASASTQSNLPQGVGRLSGSLLTFDDRLVEIFYVNSVATGRYAEVLNLYRDALEDNSRVFSILVPTQIAFLPEDYSELADSQIDMIETANSLLAEGVTAVDAYGALERQAYEYVYFRTDHHWTALGAYYAYAAFARAADIPAIPLSEYDVIEVPDFLGYRYNQAPTESLRRNPDTIYAYSYKGELETSVPLLHIPEPGQAATYGLFLGGDYPSITITTSVGNGRTAVIVKDSFANCFVPWLAPHYERIIVIDPRSYEGSVVSLVNSHDDVDLIFMINTHAVTHALMVECISSVM